MNRTILSIGGLDPSCADGIAADIKTCSAYRCYCITVLTAMTVQNSSGVQAIRPVAMEFVGQQLEALTADMEVHAVKIGMVGSAHTAEVLASLIRSYELPHVVLDPSFEPSPGGAPVIDEAGILAVRDHLLPIAGVVTANIQEAAVLAGIDVSDVPSMKEAARKIGEEYGPRAVVVTGGHLPGSRAMDVLWDGQRHSVHDAAKLSTGHTRGVGTTFSTALAVHLTRGLSLPEGINKAKQYLQKAMSHPFKITKGPGPLNHSVPV